MVRVVVDEERQVEMRKRRELERYRVRIALKGSRGNAALAKSHRDSCACQYLPQDACTIPIRVEILLYLSYFKSHGSHLFSSI